jgi:hypothetical protein
MIGCTSSFPIPSQKNSEQPRPSPGDTFELVWRFTLVGMCMQKCRVILARNTYTKICEMPDFEDECFALETEMVSSLGEALFSS